ncbi:MAG: exopolyphosphatase [Nitrospinae bacterium]|nr:exopolyphosphatase [Nitrospinota bacterium]
MRLVTRSDFDGLVSAALLEEMNIIDEMFFTHPKDLQDGKVPVSENDVLVNVPFVEGCGLWFDHHSSEEERGSLEGKFKGASQQEPSAARVVYNYYGGDEKLGKFKELMVAVDKADSAQFTREDILNPQGWELLSFICDPRTGLGYHRSYKISNKQLMEELAGHLRTKSLDEIMSLPDVQERIVRYKEQNALHKEMLEKHSRADGPIAITDLRGVDDVPPGNRHLIYAMYPDTNISIRVIDGFKKQFVSLSVGYSILNRTATVNVGSLMLKYGGGGHKAVGTCQVPYEEADGVIEAMIEAIKAES